jgi:hypothetical protein
MQPDRLLDMLGVPPGGARITFQCLTFPFILKPGFVVWSISLSKLAVHYSPLLASALRVTPLIMDARHQQPLAAKAHSPKTGRFTCSLPSFKRFLTRRTGSTTRSSVQSPVGTPHSGQAPLSGPKAAMPKGKQAIWRKQGIRPGDLTQHISNIKPVHNTTMQARPSFKYAGQNRDSSTPFQLQAGGQPGYKEILNRWSNNVPASQSYHPDEPTVEKRATYNMDSIPVVRQRRNPHIRHASGEINAARVNATWVPHSQDR